MQHIAQSETQTREIAAGLAKTLNQGDVLLLHGTLGMGKTVFARALIRAMAKDTALEVPSPTFTLVQNYDTPAGPLYHFDLYRIKDPEEIFELGWEEARAEGITIVEWPERLGPFQPATRLDIMLSSVENNQDARQILIEDKR